MVNVDDHIVEETKCVEHKNAKIAEELEIIIDTGIGMEEPPSKMT